MRNNVLPLVAALAACAGSAPEGTDAPPPLLAGELVRVDPSPSFAFTLLDTAAFDLDDDGHPERIELLATVQVDARGRPLWEDGHHWLVRVREKGGVTYPAFQDFVPWGTVEFWAVREDGDAPAALFVQTTSLLAESGGTRLERFFLDRERGGFVREGTLGAFGRVVRGAAGAEIPAPPT